MLFITKNEIQLFKAAEKYEFYGLNVMKIEMHEK